MQVVTENIVVRCIDAAANNLTAKTVRTIQNLASLPTTTISVTDNRFYGLVCALVWATCETVSEDKQRWFDLFEREVGLDRTSSFFLISFSQRTKTYGAGSIFDTLPRVIKKNELVRVF
jgi:hypothetical protein